MPRVFSTLHVYDLVSSLAPQACATGHVITAGGYLDWRCLQRPRSDDESPAVKRWSGHVESMRKDVERSFGILKGRWKVLKVPSQLSDLEKLDNTFRTCCLLHNWYARTCALAVDLLCRLTR